MKRISIDNLSINPSVLFFGTPMFAVPTLTALVKNKYPIVGVVTNPDEPVGRKQILTPPPVKVYAEARHIPVFQPERLKDAELPSADIFIVSAYGKIIPKGILEIPKFGALNVHPSLLPRWRGPSPIQSAMLAGDKETGVSIMLVDEYMDHGPICAQQVIKIGNKKITYPELQDKLAKTGAKLLIKIIPQLLKDKIIMRVQDDAKATYSQLLKKTDGRIDWTRPAQELERMVRALNSWPGTWTLWPSPEKIYRIRIDEAEYSDEEPASGSPGFVWEHKKNIFIKTGKGSLVLTQITIEGKKSMSALSLRRGYSNIIGTTLI